MYSITTRLRGPFATLQLISGTELRLACVQCDSLGTSSAVVLSSLLSEANAVAHSATVTLPWPRAMAEAMSAGLENRAATGAPTATLLFASLHLTQDRALVCTAGDLRVHLIMGDVVTEITRDHVMQADPPAFPVPAHAATVPTRWLGGICQGPPESWTWNARAPYSIAVCSSQVHRNQPPPRRKDDVLAQLDLASPQSCEGLAIWIEDSHTI